MSMSKDARTTLSLVIPAYNEEAYLDRCLQSVAAQTVPFDEVFVVDNNSTDRTAAVAAKYPFVTVLCETVQGHAAARNAGFNAVTSELIGRIDADTVLPPDWAERMIRAYRKRPGAAITGTGIFYDAPAQMALKWFHAALYYYLNRLICGYYMLWGSNMILPRHVWLQVRDKLLLSHTIAEDMDLSVAIHGICPIVLRKDIVVSVSARSARGGIKDVWRYIRRWPESLKRDSKRAHRSAWIIILIIIAVFAPAALIIGRKRYQAKH